MLSNTLKLIDDKIGAIKLLLATCIGAIVELLSLGALLPAIFLIADRTDSKILISLKNFLFKFDFIDENNFSIVILGGLILLFLLKFIYLTFYTYYKATFSLNLQVKLSNLFLLKYLKAKHQFHINNNTALMIRNVAYEVNIFYKNVFMPMLVSLLEIIISLVMVIFLLFYNFTATIALMLIMVFLFFIYTIFLKKRFASWGEERLYHDGLKLKHLKESLDFVKIIKFLNKENFFLKKFKFHNLSSGFISRKLAVVFVFPKLFLEFFLVFVIACLGIFLISRNISFNFFFETATVYVTIAYRLIPSLTRLSTNYQSIVSSKASVNALINIIENDRVEEEIFDLNKRKNLNKISFTSSIELKDVNFKYENNTEHTLEKFNLKINKNEFIGIVGKTGSGKSTLVDILLGIFPITNGKIKVDDVEIEKYNFLNFGYVPQNSYILDETIANNIAFGVDEKNIDYNKIKDVIKVSKLENFVQSYPEGINAVLSERGENLSGGQAQRINIARALYFNPDILILDEATSALDLDTENAFLKDLLSLKRNKTIILISHRKESLIYCDKIYEIKNKKIQEISNLDQ